MRLDGFNTQHRAGGAGPVAQAMVGPIFETFEWPHAHSGWKYACMSPAC